LVLIVRLVLYWTAGYEYFEYDCNGSLLVSLDEVAVEPKLKIFPNPFFEELFVETEGNQTISS
jgi:hypothetical protein